MISMLKKVNFIAICMGLNIRLVIKNIKYLFIDYLPSYKEIKKQLKTSDSKFELGQSYPIVLDKFSDGGTCSGQYFHQDLLIAQKIYEKNPATHLDIGSRMDGFITHLAVFREIEVLDIRPVNSKVKNIKFRQADLMMDIPELKEKYESVSSLHAIEHFGLGRYGDTIDIDGHIKGLESIYKLIKPRGTFYFSVPLGKLRIEFNAHRVFSLEYLLKIFKDKYEVQQFYFVDDEGDLHTNIVLSKEIIAQNCGCNNGCAIFELIKR